VINSELRLENSTVEYIEGQFLFAFEKAVVILNRNMFRFLEKSPIQT